MTRRILVLVGVWSALNSVVVAQEIQRGKLKTLDIPKLRLVVMVDGQDREFKLTRQTQVLGATGKDLAERLSGFQTGADIFFKPGRGDNRNTLVGIKLVNSPIKPAVRVSPDTSHLKPLSEMGGEMYQGFAGGLYPEGANARPRSHEMAGVRISRDIQTRDATGRVDPSGKIVLLSIGMSNTSQASDGFRRWLSEERGTNPQLQFVNGAQGGMTAAAIQDPDDGGRGTTYWATVDKRLAEANATRMQVQAIWIKQADAGPTQGFPEYARKLQTELCRIVLLLPQRFPYCQLTYLSSRTYGGYATTKLNPEPYAFESGLAVKWLIEQQLSGELELNFDPQKGPVKSPWLSWGPYLWANGSTPRTDGLCYEVSDFGGDGTHQSPSGQRKVGQLLLDFFKSDSTTRSWFLQQ